ncbi:MAG: RES family NAD+ phosphorylase [Thermoleophilia bacterium]|nr:RES family NAD+ phosphorylase [Thermoleophilia bacterium]
MKLYRIAKSAYIDDSTGAGARMHGGRWNEKGVPVIYAASSASLAALEYLVHLPIVLAPRDLSICRYDLPDNVSVKRVKTSRLLSDWKSSPPVADTQEIGTRWANSGKSLLLFVPSVLVPEEHNVLINPLHPEFRKVKKRIEAFSFDPRLVKKS